MRNLAWWKIVHNEAYFSGNTFPLVLRQKKAGGSQRYISKLANVAVLFDILADIPPSVNLYGVD